MALHRARIAWSLGDGEDFAKGRYSRGHSVTFEGGHAAPGTASAHVVGAQWAVAGSVDPEEMLVASISTCHMLSFLHVARLAGLVVTSYADEAEGVLEPNNQGRLALTRVTLHPAIAYDGAELDAASIDHLHHRAHEECFIANSVKTEVTVAPAAL
ncbi:OsmC family protein [Phenylobacterium immobile]|uniref:OsmC family protein n=1 Tax=Phenylobacterium immobile TaxID=21 RepID=UPI000B12C9BF|nr:OsmC family protein [Phenylobacterium immobile]